MSFRLQTLKKRADFLRVRKGRYSAMPGLVLQARKQEGTREGLARFGFTATKKLGKAVVRNRIKRRLREAVRLIAPQKARTGYDYVLIGRQSTLKRPFSSLLHDLARAFAHVHGRGAKGKRAQAHKRRGQRGEKRTRPTRSP